MKVRLLSLATGFLLSVPTLGSEQFDIGVPHQPTILPGNFFVLSFASQLGTIYQIEFNPDLMSAWSNYGPAIAGSGSQIDRTIVVGGSKRGFYRVTDGGLPGNLPASACAVDWTSRPVVPLVNGGLSSHFKPNGIGGYIAYFDGATQGIRLATITSTGSVGDEAVAAGSDRFCFVDIVDGEPSVAFSGPAPNQSGLKVARRSNGVWSVEDLDLSVNEAAFHSLAEPLEFAFTIPNTPGLSFWRRTGSTSEISMIAPGGGDYLKLIKRTNGLRALISRANDVARVSYESTPGEWTTESLDLLGDNRAESNSSTSLVELPSGNLGALVVTNNLSRNMFSLRLFERTTSGWQNETPFRGTGRSVSHIGLAVSPIGAVVACFSYDARLYYATRGSSGVWQKTVAAEPVDPSRGDVGQRATIAFDGLGRPVIVSRSSSNVSTAITLSTGNGR